MALFEQILSGIGAELESGLSSAAPRSFSASFGESADKSGPAPIYQLCPLPLSLNLADYRDALSDSNPQGAPLASFRFRQLVDAVPVLAHEYMASSASIETVYGQIVQGASTTGESRYLTTLIADAKRKFEMEAQSELVGQGEWRPVDALPF